MVAATLACAGQHRSAMAQDVDAGQSSTSVDVPFIATTEVPDADGLDAQLDGGAPDAAQADAGDAGAVDAGWTDGGASDASVDDAGMSETLGPLEDMLPEAISDTVSAAIASETTNDVVRTLVGMVGLLALAWLAGHDRIKRLEARFGIAPLMVSGLPFVLLGLVARAPGIDVLTEEVVLQLTPLLQFGLGWIGFHTGFQLDSRAADRFPKGSATVVILLTAVPFVLIAGVSVPTLYLLGLDHDLRDLLRDATLLGLAGALSAPAERLASAFSPAASELVRAIGVLDDVVCVIAFACVAAWLRPASESSTWVLPEVGWVFVTFGIAAVLGFLTYLVLRGTDSRAEQISLLLGAVCLTTGIAAVFSLPPLVVCFLAGVLLRNLPGEDKEKLEESFSQLERPIYHLFLLIVGALWRPESLAGWLLTPAFLLARSLGRFGGARLARVVPAADRPDALAETRNRDLVLPPMGQLAIAFVITAQTLYEAPAVRAMVTAVVVSAVLLEIGFQAALRTPAPSQRMPVVGPLATPDATLEAPVTLNDELSGREDAPREGDA